MKKLVSIVIPAHNEQDNIIEILERIDNVFVSSIYNYEILLIDDGCTDNTLSIIKVAAQEKPNIFYIELSRNFGHQVALKAGLD
ncbi:glycosyltransferase [Daejeonella sp.]|uniref:glycosyltransferase n=1 Tax=Daejeonella sp. TaxID=2805397 RepID=UPI00271A7DD3|nr:glycosyltransferase [Daejeonella sp.]MDO8992960.1 glycosyltransferase [Daejeonella sp.]MDP2414254.1 glycosyltransferase [Daejeonella sp.]